MTPLKKNRVFLETAFTISATNFFNYFFRNYITIYSIINMVIFNCLHPYNHTELYRFI